MSDVTVFIGDSVTDCGREVEPPYGDGYVHMIANSGDLKGSIINVGTSGHRIVDLEARWQRDVLDHKPTRISIAIGINDTWRRYDDNDITRVEDFEDRYRRVLNASQALLHPEFVLCEPFLLPVQEEMNTWREDLNPKIDVVHRLAKEFGAQVVAFDAHFTALAKKMAMTQLAEDGIHPTPLGHEEMAKLWLASL